MALLLAAASGTCAASASHPSAHRSLTTAPDLLIPAGSHRAVPALLAPLPPQSRRRALQLGDLPLLVRANAPAAPVPAPTPTRLRLRLRRLRRSGSGSQKGVGSSAAHSDATAAKLLRFDLAGIGFFILVCMINGVVHGTILLHLVLRIIHECPILSGWNT